MTALSSRATHTVKVFKEPALLALAALTVLALGLRLAGMGQSLYADEVFTFDDTRDGLAGVFHGLDRNEANPPLFFLLAWATAQLSDAVSSIRLPSILLGTATVPVVYALGARVAGRAAGLVAAGVVAVGPFAIFYSDEARPYATMAFFVALSSLALLNAAERGHARWWVAYGVCTCAALYSHYTAIFVVAAQAGWACWVMRDRLRTVALVHLGIVAAYLPWLPSLLDQSRKEYVALSVSPGTFFDYLLRLLAGHPFRRPGLVPGRLGLVLLAVAGATVLVGVVCARLARAPVSRRRLPRPPVALVVIVAVATPLGLVAYDAVGSTLYSPRNLIASGPALAVLVGILLTSLRRPLAAAAATLVLAALAIGTAKGFEAENQRPAFKEIAAFIDQRAHSGDTIVNQLYYGWIDPARKVNPGKFGPFNMVAPYLRREHRILDPSRQDPAAAWERAARGGRVFLVRPQAGFTVGLPTLAGPSGQVVLRDGRFYEGLLKLAVGEYRGMATARLVSRGGGRVISWSAGKNIVVSPGSARGAVEEIAARGGAPTISGWATDAGSGSPADYVLAFDGEHFLGVARTGEIRVDVAKAHGNHALLSGFHMTLRTPRGRLPSPRSKLSVFALVGSRAAELPHRQKAGR